MARIAVVLGDPTGIGPEVLAKALTSPLPSEFLLIGDLATWEEAQRVAGIQLPPLLTDRPSALGGRAPFFDLPPADRAWQPGEVSVLAGRAVVAWLQRAVQLALAHVVDAVVFAPLNKQAIISAGFPVRDEYELCASLASVAEHDEMNVIPHPAAQSDDDLLWVARVTSHLPLRDVPAQLTVDRVVRTIRLAHRVASGAGNRAPRIGVAALNPHAGEGGLLGDEEVRVIRPAIDAAIAAGITASGPHPADHIFRLARAGQFDVIVSMYHDQAQIATKLLGFERGVSVGVGYPFIMATPSHGTAFDIVGKGIADGRPMRQALVLAERLAMDARSSGPRSAQP